MKCESHFEATKHNTAIEAKEYLAAMEIAPCLAAAAAATAATEIT